MTAYVVRRILTAIPLLFVITFIIFVSTRWLPGDPISTMLGEKATPEAREAAIRRYGLDRPILEQFGIYMKGLITEGDLGESIILRPGQPLTEALKEHMKS